MALALRSGVWVRQRPATGACALVVWNAVSFVRGKETSKESRLRRLRRAAQSDEVQKDRKRAYLSAGAPGAHAAPARLIMLRACRETPSPAWQPSDAWVIISVVHSEELQGLAP